MPQTLKAEKLNCRWLGEGSPPGGDSPTALRRDPFLREIFRGVPDSLLHEAEQQPQPWGFLLDPRHNIPKEARDFFTAAESVPHAVTLVDEMPAGLASLREGRLVDQIDGYVQQGNIEGANRLGQRWVNALSKHQIGREPLFGDLDDTKGWHGLTPDNREQIEAWRSKWERNTKRRSGQAGLQPEEVSIAAKHNLEIFLIISGWLRWGHAGEPGLCFYGGDALTDFLNLLFDRGVNELACDTIRKTLLRLGLKKAAPHHPRVLEVRRVNGTGLIKIELRRPRGSVWNTLDAKQGLKICDRQLYPIPRPA